MFDINKVIQVAESDVGYLEKRSNSQLDDKTANAGDKNYTKHWRDMAPTMQGQPWCNCAVNNWFVRAYGEKDAKNLLCTKGSWSYYTPTSAGYFKNNKQYYKSDPKIGDVIFFRNSTRICHVGIVYAVDSKKVYTIEGNTSGASGVIANGGGVCKKSYDRSYSKIDGYGRPNYGLKSTITTPSSNSNCYPRYTGKSSKIDEVFEAIGAPHGNKDKRKSVAVKNGFSDYSGTLNQNIKLISLAKDGKLMK